MDPYVYVYGIGGLVFIAGLYVAGRQGYLGLRGTGLRNLMLCLGVAAFFAVLQGVLQYAPMETAPAKPYNGGADHLIDLQDRARGNWLVYTIMGGYFLTILVVGTWQGKRLKTAKDFFFGGQRFSWWLIAVSLIATTIGSYSFVKYSAMGFKYGLSSSQTYFNDWLWFPLLLFGWLPILYFSRVTSIPEYFGRRFNSTVRFWATVCILIYLGGYVGVNLYTMGKVINGLIGWPVFWSALAAALISTSYTTAGGQTSIIMTDLLQGVMLLLAGALILVMGVLHLGGFEGFWENLPRGHRAAFPPLNSDPDFPAAGIFWQDAIANSAMFYFLNQGIIMRFLASKSAQEARKAMVATIVVLMPLGAVVTGCGGWVAAALVQHGDLPATVKPDEAFFVTLEFLSRPEIFGFVLAALTAALMSTVDSLINAVAAIAVNDIYKPYIRPQATERQMLTVARWASVAVCITGVAMVPVFANFKSIYEAHGAFTAAVTPPLVAALILSVFWRRFTAAGALATFIVGGAAILASLFWPQLITPFAQGVGAGDPGVGWLAGMQQHEFMRALYGLVVCFTVGIAVSLFTRPQPLERQRGLVFGTIADAIRNYKGSEGTEQRAVRAMARVTRMDAEPQRRGEGSLPVVEISTRLAGELGAKVNDLLFVSDRRAWLGGLRATHAIVGAVEVGDEAAVRLGPQTLSVVVVPGRENEPVRVERLY